MDIREAIVLIESDYVEEAIEKLSKNPKDLLNFWVLIKEFEQPKIQRKAEDIDQEQDTVFELKYEANNNQGTT